MTEEFLPETDHEQAKLRFPNLQYIPTTGGNILHLIGKYGSNFSIFKPRFLEALSKGIDINCRDNQNLTPLLITAKYQNYNMLKYIIDNKLCNINQSYKYNSPSGAIYRNAFSLVCMSESENFDLMKYLIENGSIYNIFEDLKLIKNNSIKSQICRFILDYKESDIIDVLDNESDKSLKLTDNFRMFNFNDFEIENEVGKGVYGIVSFAIEKSTGIRCVIKKFSGYNSLSSNYHLMDQATVHDINMLKIVQRLGHTCSIYGLINKDNNYYMVLEYLKYTVNDFIYLVNKANFTKEEKENRYMGMIKETLECVHENSKAGFVHTDLKAHNLMYCRNNKLKMIDYGITEFLGLCPFEYNVDRDKYSHSYISRDGVDAIRTLNEQFTNKKISFTGDHISFQKDIPSIAIMIIGNMQIGYQFEPFFTKNGILYKYGKNSNYFISIDNNEFNSNFLNIFSQKMKDLLFAMLEVEPQKRMTAFELLNSHFFGGNGIQIERNLNITKLKKMIAFDDDIIEKIYNSYESVTSSNYYGRGFPYYDDIVKFHSVKMLPAMNDTFDLNTYDCLLKTFKYLAGEKVNLDAILNYAMYLRENKHSFHSDIKTDNFDEEHIVSAIAGIFYSNFFDDVNLNIKDVVKFGTKITNSELSNRKEIIDKYSKHFYMDTKAYNIRPLMLFVGYIKFILQCVCSNKLKIENLICNTIYKLIRYILFIHCTNGCECNGFDLVAACYCSINDNIDIGVEPSNKIIIKYIDDVSKIPKNILDEFELIKKDWSH